MTTETSPLATEKRHQRHLRLQCENDDKSVDYDDYQLRKDFNDDCNVENSYAHNDKDYSNKVGSTSCYANTSASYDA